MRSTLHRGAPNSYSGQWRATLLGDSMRLSPVHCPKRGCAVKVYPQFFDHRADFGGAVVAANPSLSTAVTYAGVTPTPPTPPPPPPPSRN
jgi:hypothetical protein